MRQSEPQLTIPHMPREIARDRHAQVTDHLDPETRRREEQEDRQAIAGERWANVAGMLMMAGAAAVTACVARSWDSFFFGPRRQDSIVIYRDPRTLLGFIVLSAITGIGLYRRRAEGEPIFPLPLIFGIGWIAALAVRIAIE